MQKSAVLFVYNWTNPDKILIHIYIYLWVACKVKEKEESSFKEDN